MAVRGAHFRVLYRQFLFRMADIEALSAHALGDVSKLLGQFAALLIFISMALGFVSLGAAGGRLPPAQAFVFTLDMEHFLIATTMLAVGLFTVLCWDTTFPDRRDVLVLAPLPVRARTIFFAKVAAVGAAMAMTIGLLHCLAGLAWPLAFQILATPQTLPALTFHNALPPVDAASLKAVMDRDLALASESGWLAAGTGTGLAIGIVRRGQRRILTYGSARADSIFEIGSISKTFTSCSYLPGKSNVNIAFLLCIWLVFGVVTAAAHWEAEAFQSVPQSAAMLSVLALAAALARWRASRSAAPEIAELRFEEEPDDAVQRLGLEPGIRRPAGI